MRKHNNTQWGFGLIELLIAIAVLTIGLLTAAFSVLNLQDLSTLAREKEAAGVDANRVLEAMRDSVDDSVSTLRGTNWTTWATNNVTTTKGANELSLDQENISVTMGGGNPVPVTLVLNWRHRGRVYAYRIVTLMTNRG